MDPYFLGEKDEHVEISGNVMVGENTQICNGAKIIGPAIIGKNCIIQSEIGPNASIGDNCTLKGCKIEDSIIMNNCKIENKIKLKNCIIAYNSEIKSNSEKNNEKMFLLGEGSKISL